MIRRLLEFLRDLFWSAMLRCPHRSTTFPITSKRRKDTYVVCLDCGQEFEYDWGAMQIARVRKKAVVIRGLFGRQRGK